MANLVGIARTTPPSEINMKIATSLFFPALIFICYVQAASANTWSVFGYDAYSSGVGQAMTGGASGPAAVFYNPAGLVKQKRASTMVSFIRGRSFLQYNPEKNPDYLDFRGFDLQSETAIQEMCGTLDDSDACVSNQLRYNNYLKQGARVSETYHAQNRSLALKAQRPKQVNGLTLGIANPLTSITDRFPIAFGVSVYLPLDPLPTLLDQEIMGPTTPHFIRYANDPHRILVNLGVAVEPIDGLRIGLAVDVNATVSADAQASALLPAELRLGSIFDLDPNISDIAIIPSGRARAELALTPTVGLQFSPNNQWDIGLSYREKQSTIIAVDAAVVIESPVGQAKIPVQIDSSIRFQPRTIAAGVAWQPRKGLRFSADLAFQQWSQYAPDFAVGGKANAADISDATCRILESFSNLDEVLGPVTDLLGLDTGSMCELIGSQIDKDIEFEVWSKEKNKLKNIFVPAFGVAYSIDRFDITGGYKFDPNPLPEQTSAFNLLAANTHVMGASLGVRISEKVSLRSFGQYHLLQHTVTTKNVSKVNADSNNIDPFPDLDSTAANGTADGFSTTSPEIEKLTEYVDGVQNLNPGSVGYSVGGGYLTGGLELIIEY